MGLAEHISWYLDAQTFGGVVPERLLAAILKAEGLYCGLVFSFPTAGHPTVEFWDRIDDLERGGFKPISAARARALCAALPAFLERLEQAAGPANADERADVARRADNSTARPRHSRATPRPQED